MGNNNAGRQIVAVTEALWEVRDKTGMTPLEILDKACEPFRRYDVSFDFGDVLDPQDRFGQILLAAFAPEYRKEAYQEDNDEWWEEWERQVLGPFWKRYNFL